MPVFGLPRLWTHSACTNCHIVQTTKEITPLRSNLHRLSQALITNYSVPEATETLVSLPSSSAPQLGGAAHVEDHNTNRKPPTVASRTPVLWCQLSTLPHLGTSTRYWSGLQTHICATCALTVHAERRKVSISPEYDKITLQHFNQIL